MTSAETITSHYGGLAASGSCCGPGGAALSLGTGDVVAAAALRPGERVLDLGAGSGHDALRAAALVGPTGSVEGIDLTPAMVERARAAAAGLSNVSFRVGDIQRLPYPDASFDVVMTNCVLNLAPDKVAVFREARRVLRHGGRLVVSDVVFLDEPDAAVRSDDALTRACVGGAARLGLYVGWLREVGLGDARIVDGYPYGTYGGGAAFAVTFVAREGDDTTRDCC